MSGLFRWFRNSTSPSPLTPILGVGAGRTGSTLLMELLGTSESVVSDRDYPHENRMLSALAFGSVAFWMAPEELPARDRTIIETVGSQLAIREKWPWRPDDRARAEGEEMLWKLFLRSNWQILSDRLRSRQPQAIYYAEKGKDSLPVLLKKAKIPFRCLLRARDLRDVWCSEDAFCQKRGHEMISASLPVMSPDERLPHFIQKMKVHYQILLDGPLPKNTLIVRYEDLVSDLAGVASRLESWLKIKLDPALALQRSQAYPQHRTSQSSTASVGRWQQEIEPRHRSVIEQELGPILKLLGYL